MLLGHIGWPAKQRKLEAALGICGQYEKKLTMTGRKDGATGHDYAQYVMQTLLSGDVEARLAAYEEAERAIQEHWVRVYLMQNPQTEAWGIVRKVDGAAARVWLDELALPAEAEASGRLTVGKRQRFRVSAADPDQQRVWVTPV